MENLLWVFLPVIVAGGSALVVFYMMKSAMEVAVAKEREALAVAHATIQSVKITMEERVKATEETTRRTTMEQLMQEFRMEERSYVRESSGPDSSKRTMVMQERMFFRNLPLSDWMEHEIVVEENQNAPLSSLTASQAHAAIGAHSSHRQGLPQMTLPQMQAREMQQPQALPKNSFPEQRNRTASVPLSKNPFANTMPPAVVTEVSGESLAALNRALAGRPMNGTSNGATPGLVMSSLVVSEAALAAMDAATVQQQNHRRAPEPDLQETAIAVREPRVFAIAFGAQ
ncbi:MAG: hypothetical protein ABI824_10205 [Acidobacteriota bacterium]